MRQSRADEILEALTLTLSQNSGKPDELTVARSRKRPTNERELPVCLIRPVSEAVRKANESRSCRMVERTLTVAVVVRAMTGDGALDKYRMFAIETIMQDMTLGGMVSEIVETSHEWSSSDDIDANLTEDVMHFDVVYATPRNTGAANI